MNFQTNEHLPSKRLTIRTHDSETNKFSILADSKEQKDNKKTELNLFSNIIIPQSLIKQNTNIQLLYSIIKKTSKKI